MEDSSRRNALVAKCVLEGKNVLQTSKDPSELCLALKRIGSFLPGTRSEATAGSDAEAPTMKSLVDDKLSVADESAAKLEFNHRHYLRFIEFLCDQLSLEWYGRFGRDSEGNALFNRFFLAGVPQDALLVLCAAIDNSSPSFKQKKCCLLLEEFFKTHQLQEMLCSMCDILPPAGQRSKSLTFDPQWTQVMTLIVTLPDRMSNRLKKECSDFFFPNQYIPTVTKEIIQSLHYVHQKLSKSEDCSLELVSQLIGRLVLQGHTERVFDVLLPHLLRLATSDFIWSRIATRVLAGAPERSLEGILEYLLRKTPWFGLVSRLLGDAVLTNPKINLLLTHKFLLLRHYDDVIIPQNLIGYLACSASRRHLVMKVLRSVFATWGDRSAVKHTSHSQHAYLTRVMVICVGHLNDEEKKQHKGDLHTRLMGGVQAHLESPLLRVRKLGMVAAEIIAATLDPSGPKLKFEYEEDEESRLLWSLVKPPEDPGLDDVTRGLDAVQFDSPSLNQTSDEAIVNETSSTHAPSTDNAELDSDDEFEPYDMSHDTKVTKVKVPVYIRDCMDGLIARENPELTEASLRVAEKLIRARPDDLQDVCTQLVAILLHLEDQYSTENFRYQRHSAMVALTAHCPVEVTKYLTEEFYNRNYNIRQRMDILEVLAAGAQELSKPGSSSSRDQEPPPPAAPARGRRSTELLVDPLRGERENRGGAAGDGEDWRQIVQKRIEGKTRRFGKGPSKPAVQPVASRFAPVAGHFFFPLLKSYDRKLQTMDLLGGDFLLLGRLVYTLGVIMYAAQNSPACLHMATSLFDLVWSLRYHTEVYVRQSLMFAVSMVTLSIPAHLLVSDLQSEIMECRCWLQDIVEQDPEPECKALGAQTLMVIDTTISKELKGER